MSYPIFEVEVTQPLPTLSISERDTGMAVLLRRKGRPIGFWMEARPEGRTLSPAALAQRIREKAGAKLLGESMREELASPAIKPAKHKRTKQERLPSLTVAICTKDRPTLLARCLKSLQALPQEVQDISVSLEILVVDNTPSDKQTQKLVASLPEVRYAREPKPGLDFARNRALQEATGELLAFLDDDVVIDRDWLSGLWEAWSENPDAAAFTGPVLPYELDTEAQIMFERQGGFHEGPGKGFKKERYGQSRSDISFYPHKADRFGAGANMAFRRDILQQIGGFDEALDTGAPLPGGGDLDIFYRVIRAGYPLVYEPRYLVFHQHRRDVEALRRQYRSWGLGFMAFVVKSYQTDPPQRSKLRRLVLWWFKYQLRQLLKSLAGRHMLPPGMIIAELKGGIAGLLGGYYRSSKRIEQIRRQFA